MSHLLSFANAITKDLSHHLVGLRLTAAFWSAARESNEARQAAPYDALRSPYCGDNATARPVRMDSLAASRISITPTFSSGATGFSMGLPLRMHQTK